MKQSICEPNNQRQNEFDGKTRLLKRHWKNRMAPNNYPKQLWDFPLVYEAEILVMIMRGEDVILGLEKVMGGTVDITEYLNFAFWDLVWFGDDPDKEPCFGRWLGVHIVWV